MGKKVGVNEYVEARSKQGTTGVCTETCPLQHLYRKPAGPDKIPLSKFVKTSHCGEELTCSTAGLPLRETHSHRLWETPKFLLEDTSNSMCIFSRRKLGRGNEQETR